MRVISRKALREFWEKHSTSKRSMNAWLKEVKKAEWSTTADIRETYRSADFVGDNRVVFDIGNNRWRIVAWIRFEVHSVFIKWVGTHKEYESIDVKTVGLKKKVTR